jgi:hypothetical protein
MLHLIKLCVGIRDLAHLAEVQAGRLKAGTPLCHRTRNFPRRAPEIVDGGSMFWVIKGSILARQLITGIEPETDGDRPHARIDLHPILVPLRPKTMKPFQGWRYLQPENAPPDLGNTNEGADNPDMPEGLRAQLIDLCLI